MSTPRRPLLPATFPGRRHPLVPTVDLRKRVRGSNACEACRRHKSKCTGEQPSCSECIKRERVCRHTPTETRQVRQKYDDLRQRQSEHEELVDLMRTLPEEDATEVFRRVRAGSNAGAIVSHVKDGNLLLQLQLAVRPEIHLQYKTLLHVRHTNAYPTLLPPDDRAAGLGQKKESVSNIDLTKGCIARLHQPKFINDPHTVCDKRLLQVNARRWTTVTDDNLTIANLFSLYLSWEHQSFKIFDEEYFVEQLVNGKTDYCSSLLVNAVLAVAALYYKVIDPLEAETLSRGFYEEARRLWNIEEGNGDLLHIPASVMLNQWCNYNSKDELGATFLAQGVQVAKDLGYFRRSHNPNQPTVDTLSKIQRGRAIIAWGIFNWQAIHGFFAQFESQFSRPPSFTFPHEQSSNQDGHMVWQSFPLLFTGQAPSQGLVFGAVSKLFVILNDYMILRDTFTTTADDSSTLENVKLLHFKLLDWIDSLHPELLRDARCSPAVLNMHLYYHAIIIEIFRPFASKSSALQSPARQWTNASLNQLRRILLIQQHRFGGPPVSGVNVAAIHIVAFALFEEWSTSDIPATGTEFDLLLSMRLMQEYGRCFPIVNVILHSLIANAKLRFPAIPKEVEAIYLELDKGISKGISIEEI